MKSRPLYSLRSLSWILAGVLFVLTALQFGWITFSYLAIERIHGQIDWVRQQQSYFNTLHLHPDIPASRKRALIRQVDQGLELLKKGGHISASGNNLPPISYAAALTLEALQNHWKAFVNSSDSVTRNMNAWFVDGHFDTIIRDLERDKEKKEKKLLWIAGGNLIITALVVFGLALIFNKKVVNSLTRMTNNIKNHNHTTDVATHELKQLATSISDVVENLRDATDFVTVIGEGDLTKDYRELEPQYEPGKNKLADALIAMQQKLRSINEEEQKRKWANEGLARFVDILRKNQHNLQQLGDEITATLVQYTHSIQGGLYVINDNDPSKPVIELLSLYAFNIKKYQQQKILPGEGLIGQAYLEKDTVYLKEIPEDYIRITSGLGDANPRNLLIVPFKLDDKVYGLVELASFHLYQPHEIAFVEKLGETLASTLASVKANQQTRRLLEESKMAAEALRAQEEEMRQNMEELTATQEEMQRILTESQQKETFLSNLLDATSDAFVAIDRSYHVVLRNNAPLFEQFIKAGIPYHKGYYVLSLFRPDEQEYHKAIYDRVFNGEIITVTKEYFGKPYEVNYRPLRAAGGDIIGAAIFARDLSEKMDREKRIQDLEEQLRQKGSGSQLNEMEKTLRFHLEALEITRQAWANRGTPPSSTV
jgi:GAF domain-containing protein